MLYVASYIHICIYFYIYITASYIVPLHFKLSQCLITHCPQSSAHKPPLRNAVHHYHTAYKMCYTYNYRSHVMNAHKGLMGACVQYTQTLLKSAHCSEAFIVEK